MVKTQTETDASAETPRKIALRLEASQIRLADRQAVARSRPELIDELCEEKWESQTEEAHRSRHVTKRIAPVV